MASKSSASVSFFLILNILSFALARACYTCPPEKTAPPPPPPSTSTGTPCPPPPAPAKCPRDTLKLGVCANVFKGLINVHLGKPPKEPCCSLLDGLVDLDAAVCLCTVLKANVLGLKLDLPIDLSLVLNYCGKTAPTGYQCY